MIEPSQPNSEDGYRGLAVGKIVARIVRAPKQSTQSGDGDHRLMLLHPDIVQMKAAEDSMRL